ncbi:plasmid stabilization protein [Clostridia bacterium]|nr:plasmid stabilization protein [Clostridia bacterium]
MTTTYSKKSLKAMIHMDKSTRKRISVAISEIPNGDILPLKGYTNTYRLRVGDWRIIFSYVEDDEILVDKIMPRGDVYKGM